MEEKKRKKRKIKVKNVVKLSLLLVVFGLVLYTTIHFGKNIVIGKKEVRYLANDMPLVAIYDKEGKELEAKARGTKVLFQENKTITIDEETLYAIVIDKEEAYVKKDFLVENEKEVVKEKIVYVRTPQNLYENPTDGTLLQLVKKGEALTVVGFDGLKEDGNVDLYRVKVNDIEGYIYKKYVTLDNESALAHYDPDNYYTVHQERGDRYGGGDAGALDYFPVEKPKFENNKMPDQVYALYLNCGKNVINNVDDYIAFAKETKINAFVVDIKDNTTPAYSSKVMEKYSKTNAEHAYNSIEDYKKAIDKIKEAGFYVIGRITVFKDEYYAMDHPEHAIRNTKTDGLFEHSGTYWPSPFQRGVWEFNVALAKEAVQEMGFNEIQFDYVRCPDRTYQLEQQGIMDFRNTYDEDKAQAIQRFLQYATDELHKLNVYVSADVFGESAHSYVTAYGQYWAAISNVVDVISAMPYPDHFNKYEYGFTQPVWSIPYDILNYWGKTYVANRQKEIPTPAIARTWIQTYDTIREPYLTYGAKEVSDQIKGLYDAGLNGGYMTWNSGSNLSKYKSQKSAYSKEY